MKRKRLTPQPSDQAVLDEHEQEIEDYFDAGEKYSPVVVRKKMKEAQIAAANHLRTKDKRISIRIYGEDLERIREIAAEEGLPYQTLITSVLHKFSTGLMASTKKER